MCESHLPGTDERFDSTHIPSVECDAGGQSPSRPPAHVSRRSVLRALGAGSAGWILGRPLLDATPALGDTFTGRRPVTAAMHVHGSWSEGPGSWEAYGPVARASGVDVIFPTDHSYRAWAAGYWTSLVGMFFEVLPSGTFAQRASVPSQSQTVPNADPLRLLVESASSTTAASLALKVSEANDRQIREKLRTSISATTLHATFSQARLTNGATFEVRVTLSKHPSFGTRPAGIPQLVYRFGTGSTVGRLVEGGGLTGVVTRPLPAIGTAVVLDLEADVQALWPDMLAYDNSLSGLSFVARSPRRGAVADVRLTCQIVRGGRNADSFTTMQRTLADTYGSRYGVTLHPSIELGRTVHLNGYSAAQFLPSEELNVTQTRDRYYNEAVAEFHARGGLVSWNHPFGSDTGPLKTASGQATERRELFQSMMGKSLYGVDIVEVGYVTRGQVDMATHLALWDTFSRHARFLTGNGVNDDHGAGNWLTLNNGFSTGLWAETTGHAELMAALRGGRAYTAHAGRFPGGQLDLLVDGTVPMGKASISSASSRHLEIQAVNLPGGSRVELVGGPVDQTGSDPGTTILDSIPASSFGTAGIVGRAVDTSSPVFVRTQVRNSSGALIGASNPVWLLRGMPPTGIPASRVV